MTTSTTPTTTKLHPADRAYITELAHKDWSADRSLNYMPVVLHLPKTKAKARYLLAGLTHYYAQRTAARPLPEPVELYLDIIKSIAADTAKERRELGRAVYTRFKALSPDPLSDYFKNWIQNKPGGKTDHEYHELDLWLIEQGRSKVGKGRPRRIHYTKEQLQAVITEQKITNRTELQNLNRSVYTFFMRKENRHILNVLLPTTKDRKRLSSTKAKKVPKVTYTEKQLKDYIEQNNIENRAQLSRTNLKMYNFFNRNSTRALLRSVLPTQTAGRRKGTVKPRWNLERIKQVASEINGNRSLFHRKYAKGYKWLMNNGHSELYHKLFPTKMGLRMPVDELINRASKYATKGLLMKSEPVVYRQLYRHHRELFNELFKAKKG
ncbi:hypothetical protein [Shewanella algae]|uniref:hypothetical protein n=1 Tax=Shewanella algae TaxID=38313 RepID=UPI001AACC08A|nr:hypothetical protein [Shewanella algae]MBO2682803.1 hypothetical protein [Shewanella algae]